jgi:hypothetical protein
VGPVEQAIRSTFAVGARLQTPSRPSPFLISAIDGRGIVLDLAMKYPTRIDWRCLEGTVTFLRGRGWVRCAGRHSLESEPCSFDEYLKRNGPARDVTNWVAVVLEKAGIAQLDVGPPLEIRLRPDL